MRITTFASVVPLLVLGACKQGAATDEAVAELAADSGQSGQAEGALFATSTDGVALAGFAAPAVPAPDQAAAYVAAHIGARFTPAGCVNATASGTTVVAVFTSCTGPRGLRTVSGTLNLMFSAAATGGLQVDASGTGMEIGEATVDVSATAIYNSDGTTQTLDVTTMSSGTGPLGNDFTHSGDYTVTWDGSCATVDGSWSTEASDRSRGTTVDLTRCQQGCPTGTVTRDTFAGRTITVTFDGTATATWTSSAGRSGTIELTCGQ